MCWAQKPECSCTPCLMEQFNKYASDDIKQKVQERENEKDAERRLSDRRNER